MTVLCTVDAALALIGISELRDASATVAATTPTLTQARVFVEAVSAEVVMHLRARSIDPDDVESDYLKHVAAMGTAAHIAKARWPGASGPGSDAGAGGLLDRQYGEALAFIDHGGLDTYASSTTLGTSPSIAHGFTDADGTAYEPQFTRAMEW